MREPAETQAQVHSTGLFRMEGERKMGGRVQMWQWSKSNACMRDLGRVGEESHTVSMGQAHPSFAHASPGPGFTPDILPYTVRGAYRMVCSWQAWHLHLPRTLPPYLSAYTSRCVERASSRLGCAPPSRGRCVKKAVAQCVTPEGGMICGEGRQDHAEARGRGRRCALTVARFVGGRGRAHLFVYACAHPSDSASMPCATTEEVIAALRVIRSDSEPKCTAQDCRKGDMGRGASPLGATKTLAASRIHAVFPSRSVECRVASAGTGSARTPFPPVPQAAG